MLIKEPVMTDSLEADQSATVVITHHVLDVHHDAYENWLKEIGSIAKSYPGHLGVMIIRPIPGATSTYTIVIRFDTRDHLLAWMGSADRNRLIEKVQPLLMEDDRYLVQSGLDFWFTPEGIKPKFPKRWKQSVLTWSAIYPLVLSISLLVEFLRRYLGVADHHYLQLLLITGIVVWLMVYVVMPRYTKLVHRWLHT
jgi:antibiotic biosynthesis monooxygenase (ABM) superfamily enzyme